ncbi:L-2,4-diaminobutyric acid acetyltransferase [Streptomyces subrutilus]|uniref:L-2,4-diaminobutyric acid acetyltransferase n=1 Tax=Streptomyces subrutilus TaxID=36818 RepID=A0A5P2USB5_9ACTN|nr:diaminobutyrate acetyltransferase [Streptomyces subrutilus]QEU82236.1 diaminobutyrate acetyltransferase [Streptomyces subrutilus]GGZ95504.1 L-2,4-diaminobutyric acid acetyltransferase [Streptomyces subrutilus]
MTTAPADLDRSRSGFPGLPGELRLDSPDTGDGASLWRIARDSKVLDLNSPYSYLLWCRDFAGTSAVARDMSGQPVGFVSAYRRPEAPGTLFVWQVAVDEALRGQGVAGALLDGLTAREARRSGGLRGLETTIEPGNTASERLFAAYADRHGATLTREVLFAPGHFPEGDGHAAEVLHRIALPAR